VGGRCSGAATTRAVAPAPPPLATSTPQPHSHTFPQGYVLQMQAAKLGVVTRRNLAEHCRRRLARGPRLLLWVMAEIAIIGSDIQGEGGVWGWDGFQGEDVFGNGAAAGAAWPSIAGPTRQPRLLAAAPAPPHPTLPPCDRGHRQRDRDPAAHARRGAAVGRHPAVRRGLLRAARR
jgi:hypothetical protein